MTPTETLQATLAFFIVSTAVVVIFAKTARGGDGDDAGERHSDYEGD